MRIMKNRTILHGKVRSIRPLPDGIGADVEFEVESSAPAKGYSDFVQAEPGSSLTVFAAEPDSVRPGGKYTVTASVLGGPNGERVVIEDAKAER
jgi:hypothetical protein